MDMKPLNSLFNDVWCIGTSTSSAMQKLAQTHDTLKRLAYVCNGSICTRCISSKTNRELVKEVTTWT